MAKNKSVLLLASELLTRVYAGYFGTKNRAELISRVQGIALEAENEYKRGFVDGQRDERDWKQKKP